MVVDSWECSWEEDEAGGNPLDGFEDSQAHNLDVNCCGAARRAETPANGWLVNGESHHR